MKGVMKALCNFISGEGVYKSIKVYLKLRGGNNLFTSAWVTVDYIYNIISTIGMTLIVMYFAMSIIDKVSNGQMTLELFVPEFIKMATAVFFVSEGFHILTSTVDIGVDIANKIVSTKSPANISKQLTDQYTQGNTMDMIANILLLIFPFVISLLARGLIIMISIGRALELLIRVAFSPIAFADMYNGGLNSSGFKYFKKFLALSLQATLIVAVLMIQQTFTTNLLGKNSWGTLVGLIDLTLISLASAGFITKSQGVVNDVVGV